MGLDGVELVMGFEEAFGIAIPDAIASEMITPRHTIDHVASSLVVSPVARCGCLTQHIFYRLRSGLRSFVAQGVTLRPATTIHELVRKGEWPGLWSRVRETAGNADWPEHVPWKGWLFEGPRTLRELTLHVAMLLPAPDLVRGESWTRERIELIVRRVVWETIGLQGFELDDEYVRDMGVD